jgi:flagellar biosynthetic protein FliR
MIGALAALQEVFGAHALLFLTAFMRIGTLILLAPGLGDRLIPMRVRLVGGMALAAAAMPSLDAAPPLGVGLALSEGAVGLALGAALRFVAQALIMAGMMAAQLTSLSHLFGGVEPSSAVGNLLNMAGLCLLMASGLPLWLLDCAIRSYDVLPLGAALPGSDVARWGVDRLAGAFALAFGLAAPFALAALLYNLAMGVINRAMPQLMVALVGAPAITGAAGVILLLSAPLILTVWREAMLATLADPVAGGLP